MTGKTFAMTTALMVSATLIGYLPHAAADAGEPFTMRPSTSTHACEKNGDGL